MSRDAPSLATALGRGLTRRCARCGAGGLFTRWVRMRASCPGCGLHFEREPGYWVGALAMNFVIVGGVLAAMLVVTFAATVPDVPVGPIIAIGLPVAILGPVLTYPMSRTLWVAVDRAVLGRLDRHERPDEQTRI